MARLRAVEGKLGLEYAYVPTSLDLEKSFSAGPCSRYYLA